MKDSLIFNHRVGGQLAITRALGDLHLKSYGVSNIPEYDEFEVTASTKLLIMASDGLWDVCEDHFAVDICRNLTEPNQMAKKLVDMAIDEGSRDNVSVMIIEF